EESTSASRSLWMISSELKRFLGIVQSPRHKSMNFGSGPEISGQLSGVDRDGQAQYAGGAAAHDDDARASA
ncbi:hypothetical protein, partial [Dyella acidiphila]|uniref:hypothetical protein n=1 Tax=Dyella acidiphila TaxID=2775866 RepID=UPI001CE47CEB